MLRQGLQREVLLAAGIALIPLRVEVGLAQQRNAAHQRSGIILGTGALIERQARGRFIQQNHLLLLKIGIQAHQRRSAAHDAIGRLREHRPEAQRPVCPGLVLIYFELLGRVHFGVNGLVPVVSPSFLAVELRATAAALAVSGLGLGHAIAGVHIHEAGVDVLATQVLNHGPSRDFYRGRRTSGYHFPVPNHQRGITNFGLIINKQRGMGESK